MHVCVYIVELIIHTHHISSSLYIAFFGPVLSPFSGALSKKKESERSLTSVVVSLNLLDFLQ